MKRVVLAVLAAASLAGCQDIQQPPTASFLVSDGANGGNPHFYFLPPIVPTPSYTGVFDPTLLPYVEVQIRGPVADPTAPGCSDTNGPVFTSFASPDVTVAPANRAALV